MLVCTDYRLEYKVDSIEDPQNREGRKAKGGRRYKCKEKEGENYKFYKQMCVSQLENIEK